ncbi:NERD domain-containing protein [Paenibacillus borealis]|uniref:NERD domain-containing protein n=1 Tax=Paenibacillus borealis TaxID=160799 RepID=UPI0009DD7541|nr:NERD domain-containing protein [Paenibacillus borealis]
MIAEIHNKISKTGSNLSDRLEDQLTGDFFGAIRYLPFEAALQHVLTAVRFETTDQESDWRESLQSTKGFDYEIEFWVRLAEGEIDLIIHLPDAVIGIEVKYYSGLSSDDEETEEVVSPGESINQLARYSRLLQELKQGKPAYLIFLAPLNTLMPVQRDMRTRTIIAKNIKLGFLTWQNVLEQLQSIGLQDLGKGQQRIMQDLIAHLLGKGFERFRGFSSVSKDSLMNGQPYTFHKKTMSRLNLLWPIHQKVQEGNYVYVK